jgi:hypothetical protein
MERFPMSNRTLQNLHKECLVTSISTAVVDSATCGDKNHYVYINKLRLMSFCEEELKYILDKVQQNFPESTVSLKVVSRGRQVHITLSELSLVLVTCSMNEDARVAICVDWSM